MSSNSGKYQCLFQSICNLFILDITDIGAGKHREETWSNNQYNSEIANQFSAYVVINGHAFSVGEEAFAQQWDSNKLVLLLYYILSSQIGMDIGTVVIRPRQT